MTYVRRYLLGAALVASLLVSFVVARPASAADASANTGEFSIQVSPSPLVSTVKPGQTTTLELTIRNTSGGDEYLKITPRAFKIDDKSQKLELQDDKIPDIASWLTFSAPTFSVKSKQSFTQKITLNVPKEAGFSYAFALVINRVSTPLQPTGNTLKASIAVFSLLNVDRPGAVRKLEVSKFTTTKSSYEYLPAVFEVEFKNTGNTIVQPSGTIFIQRGPKDVVPIDTLDVNEGGGYILPGTSRTLTAQWDKGFQVMAPKVQADGTTKDELSWNWNQLSQIRFGQYTAKLIAIYDDGQRDVPLEAELTFW